MVALVMSLAGASAILRPDLLRSHLVRHQSQQAATKVLQNDDGMTVMPQFA